MAVKMIDFDELESVVDRLLGKLGVSDSLSEKDQVVALKSLNTDMSLLETLAYILALKVKGGCSEEEFFKFYERVLNQANLYLCAGLDVRNLKAANIEGLIDEADALNKAALNLRRACANLKVKSEAEPDPWSDANEV
jgi:hypothetical protein